jgi:hypothetical protein
VLGASTAVFATPFAFGYALHANRSAPDPGFGRVALVLATLESLVLLVLGGGWLWNQLG